MVIFNIILYITIGFIVYFGYQTVLHYHKHENVNFLRGLIISTLVLAVLYKFIGHYQILLGCFYGCSLCSCLLAWQLVLGTLQLIRKIRKREKWN